jgi:predicted ATPase
MKLTELCIKGFKSFDGNEEQRIPFGNVTVLLGANGAGKSNLVSFFRMMNFMTTGALQQYVGKHGVTQTLFFGPKRTESVVFTLTFDSEDARDTYEYEVGLSYGLPDRLFVSGERVSYLKKGNPQPQEYFLEIGGSETGLKKDTRTTSKVLFGLLAGIRTYQFHDTSDTAKIKDRGYVDDVKYLRSDAGNLGAFLRMLKDSYDYRKYYDRIVRHIRSVMPQFGDFDLTPLQDKGSYVRLNWTDSIGSDYLFGPDQLSDGSLRFMALTTLLLQPPKLLPKFIVLDEPELGLHPAAIAELAGMIRSASEKTQVLAATQSMRLVDEFSPENLVIVELDEQRSCSIFKKLDTEQLKDWLDRYSLSELWEKNVLGGQP